MSRDTGVSASYISGLLHNNYIPSVKILSKLIDPKSKPQKIISSETLSDAIVNKSVYIVNKSLCDDYDEELEIRIAKVSNLLEECVKELNEINRIRLERHIKKQS